MIRKTESVLSKESFYENCRYILDCKRYPKPLLFREKAEYALDEKYVAYLWMMSSVNRLGVTNRWGAKELIFPSNPEDINIALTSLNLELDLELDIDEDLLENYTVNEIENYFDYDIISLTQLHMVATDLAEFEEKALRQNKYSKLYTGIRDKIEAFPDIPKLGDNFKNDIMKFIVNNYDPSSGEFLISKLLIQLVYSYALIVFPDYVFPLVITMGTVRELPYDIVTDLVELMNLHLRMYNANFETYDRFGTSELRSMLYTVTNKLIVDDSNSNDIKEIVNKILQYRYNTKK